MEMPARLAVRVRKRRRTLKGRSYEWVERRVLIPADFPDAREVIVMTVEEYEELVKVVKEAISRMKTAIDLILRVLKNEGR